MTRTLPARRRALHLLAGALLGRPLAWPMVPRLSAGALALRGAGAAMPVAGPAAAAVAATTTNPTPANAQGQVPLPGQGRATAPAPFAPPRLEALAPGVWLVRGAPGESDAANRGATSNLLVVAEGERTWALGCGASPGQGRALAAAVQAQTGRALTDLVASWAHPEAVLGAAGLPALRFWAHEEVAQAMQARCGTCIERLALRLGAAAGDLAELPDAAATRDAAAAPSSEAASLKQARIPEQRLQGEQGRVGPWHWWRLQRAREPAEEARRRGPGEAPRNPTLVTTLWWLPQAGLWSAPGLLWSDGPPDLRDSEIASLLPATRTARAIAGQVAPASVATPPPAGSSPPGPLAMPRWLPEQGEPQDGSLLDQHEHYWTALRGAATQAWEDGRPETDPPPRLQDPAFPAAWTQHQRHGLNWQRAWREAEATALARPS